MTFDSWTPPVPLAGDDMLAVWDLLERPAWHRMAACRGMSPDLFFPERGESQKAVMAVCAACPVWVECAEAGKRELTGIWGGTTGRERRRNRLAA